MSKTKETQQREAQLALEGAIDAVLSVIELTNCPQDRYRETLRKLREDERKYQD